MVRNAALLNVEPMLDIAAATGNESAFINANTHHIVAFYVMACFHPCLRWLNPPFTVLFMVHNGSWPMMSNVF